MASKRGRGLAVQAAIPRGAQLPPLRGILAKPETFRSFISRKIAASCSGLRRGLGTKPSFPTDCGNSRFRWKRSLAPRSITGAECTTLVESSQAAFGVYSQQADLAVRPDSHLIKSVRSLRCFNANASVKNRKQAQGSIDVKEHPIHGDASPEHPRRDKGISLLLSRPHDSSFPNGGC